MPRSYRLCRSLCTKRVIEELQVAVHCSLTLVFDGLSISSVEDESGESVEFALGLLWLLLGAYHTDHMGYAIDIYRTLCYELLKIGLGLLAMPAPISVVHCECILLRGGYLEGFQIAGAVHIHVS